MLTCSFRVFGVWGVFFATFLFCQSYWILPERQSLYIVTFWILSAFFIGIAATTTRTIPDGIKTYGPLFTVIGAIFASVVFDKRKPISDLGQHDIEARQSGISEDMALPSHPREEALNEVRTRLE